MKRVTGIGGVFFKSEDPQKMKDWYRAHLGIDAGPYGASFKWRAEAGSDEVCLTNWSPFEKNTQYFAPSQNDYMFNYRVDDLKALLAALQEEGVEVVGEIEEYEYGKFGWILDPEGRKIELWEPVDSGFGDDK